MRFWSTRIKLLIGAVALATAPSVVQATTLPSLPQTPAVEAPMAPTDDCVTYTIAYEYMTTVYPDAVLIEANPQYMVFSAESKPTDLRINFDTLGCVVSVEAVNRIAS